MDLFEQRAQERLEEEAPLAHRMRPRSLDDYVGQAHIVGPGRLLRRAIQADQVSSVIFYGPPGTGKTTLATIIAQHTRTHFISINAVLAGVKDIRQAIDEAHHRLKMQGQRTTLFVDEVHRWNKAQQDALLPHVENGAIILIGATTENPFFEVIKALVSRSRIFQLKPLRRDDLVTLAHRALTDKERGFGGRNVTIEPAALDHLVDVANGDARGVLNALELAVETTPPGPDGAINIDLPVAEESIQTRAVLYDKDGDVHYDTISAFIKSLRGSDPDAALYWMARMIFAGEDPRFILRRMAIVASEDVGLADPNAVTVVNSCWEIFDKIGLPEGRFPLAQAALYLATCPKSNSTMAFFDALASVEKEQEEDVPNHLRDPARDKEGFGHGKGYLYPHAFRDHWVAQQYLPRGLQGRLFYQPSDQGHEGHIRDEVTRRREAQLGAMLTAEREDNDEILSTSPRSRRADAWLDRTLAGASERLGAVRDEVIDRAQLKRHHVVLIESDPGSVIIWEVIRRVPEGGVVIRSGESGADRLLKERFESLPELLRPRVIAPGEFPEGIAFDVIFTHEAFTSGGNASSILDGLDERLSEGGRVVVAQPVPRKGQRLSHLADMERLDVSLVERLRQAEDQIYQDPEDPRTAWDEVDLVASLNHPGWHLKHDLIDVSTPRRLVRRELDVWLKAPSPLDSRPPDSRRTYLERLSDAGLTQQEIETIRRHLRDALSDRSLIWTTPVLYVTLTRAKRFRNEV